MSLNELDLGELEDRSFREDIKLDRFKLDIECGKQAALYLHWSEKFSDAKKEKDRLQIKLDYTKSDVNLNLRKNPPLDKKLTEAQIAAHVETHDDVQAVHEELLNAKYQVETLGGVVRALEQKKSQLDNLRHLFIAGYYGDPGRKAEVETASQNLRRGMNDRRRNEKE